MPERPHHRPVPLPPDVVADVADVTAGTTPEAELLERLDSALRLLPPAERNAALTAHAAEDGVAAVAERYGLSHAEADALTRNAVQLLRGALADVDPDAAAYGTITRRASAAKKRAD